MSAAASSRRAVHLLSAVALATISLMAQASTSGVVISQVYGGGGNTGATYTHDFIELFNAGNAPVNLNGWSVQYASATGASWQMTALGNVLLQPGQYYLVQEAQGNGGSTALPTPDAQSGTPNTIAMSGTAGKVALVSSTSALPSTSPTGPTVVDYVGFGANANASEGASPTPAPSNTTAVIRLNAGCTDTDVNGADFVAGAPTPRNTATALNVCNGTGGGGGTGGGSTGSALKIHEIQGTGSTSPFVNANVVTSGVVTKVTNNGFYVQDPLGDGNPLTSDGILVFTSTAPTVTAGQLVQVSGKVAEFNVGAASNAQTLAHTVTEITTPTVTIQGSGQSITPTPITLPVATDAELERVEGMLVTINSQLTASQNFFLGRFGQVTLSANGRLEVPTNRFRPGASAQALAQQNALSSIMLDDGTTQQNPNPTPYFAVDNTLRAGDTVDAITGVIDYGLATTTNTGLADYKIHPTQPITFTRINVRTSVPEEVGGNIKVASANVLNFFTTFTDGNTAAGLSGQGCTLGGAVAASNCRGANNLAEFNRQRAKIVQAIASANGDVVGLMEIQNNVPNASGSGANADTAVLNLVSALNAQLGSGTYAVVPAPAGSTGTDAIRVALIYKPAKLSLSGAALSDTDAINNRPPLAQTFVAANGEKFSVVVNHLKSKGSCPSSASDPDADQGDLQGCWNDQRVQQAARLRNFVTTVQTNSGNPDVIVIGDLNAYAKEDPIEELTSHGYVDEIARFNSFGYSYVFDGAAGRLDHAITTPTLSTKVTRAIEWHINADEPSVIDYNTEFKQPACPACGPDYYSALPYRSSDHDPVIVGLNLLKSVNGTPGRDTLTGTAGDDLISGGEGSDNITTGVGRDVLVYASLRDGLDTVTDFAPGADRIDLSGLLATLGVPSAQAISGGFVRLVNSSAGVQVQIDADGSAGPAVPKAVAVLRGVVASQLQTARDLIL
ncbi:ExeM/NucH family extracellular endonuclease [Aquabacterium sp.]|uniref:ExeM/NucH family extracellular endonuclease n=1 Tax=Aquabacterium sp. TaxID=1872578 RepID=UPI002487AF11|nr:ExeM/NucH family extracellular endonuclease [Aquabacterium sp.]MDI1257907.1 ExeM/NucH family extracellular endonuclease [Aquabacterium sp.]